MRRTVSLILVLLFAASLTTGCFLKRGGSGDAAAGAAGTPPTRIARDTNVLPDSVAANRLPDGTLRVTWKTKTPAAGGYALGANLFFEERPLYASFGKESAETPTLEHEAILAGVAPGKAKVAVAYGENELTDNGGLGYPVAE